METVLSLIIFNLIAFYCLSFCRNQKKIDILDKGNEKGFVSTKPKPKLDPMQPTVLRVLLRSEISYKKMRSPINISRHLNPKYPVPALKKVNTPK